MNTTEQNSGKRVYISPALERVRLDNGISLALQSGPPIGPDEVRAPKPEFMNNDPYHMA